MKVIDPGHHYLLTELDGGSAQPLVFVKREGPGYPGNSGHHPGVTIQEVLRALIDRCLYVQDQIPCSETHEATFMLRRALYLLEQRAAVRHGVVGEIEPEGTAEEEPTCPKCGHWPSAHLVPCEVFP